MDDIEYEGTVKWGVTTSRSYLPKDNSRDFAGGESILDWLRQFASKEEDDNTFLRGFLGRMLFSSDTKLTSLSTSCCGEKKFVSYLSKLILLKSNVLVLDGPTNHLDLESISSLNDGLKNFKESIILPAMTTNSLNTLNHIIVLSKNGVMVVLMGNLAMSFLKMKKFKQSERTLKSIIKIKEPWNNDFRLFQ